jgi:hypothetical protein
VPLRHLRPQLRKIRRAFLLKTKELNRVSKLGMAWQDLKSVFSLRLSVSNPQFFPQLAGLVPQISTGGSGNLFAIVDH